MCWRESYNSGVLQTRNPTFPICCNPMAVVAGGLTVTDFQTKPGRRFCNCKFSTANRVLTR